MYYWKVWLWENGHKSVDYTDHTLAPIFIEDRLDETLDTAEVILESMPIASKTAFPPKTKFRIERYANTACTGEPKTWDFVVEHDDVEEYPGCPDICCHRIHLIEPSVVAQGMHVDNIALTYELQDVDLNYKTYRDMSAKVTPNVHVDSRSYPPINTYDDSNTAAKEYFLGHTTTVPRYERTFIYEWDEASLNSIRNLSLECDAMEEHTISFTVPKLMFRFARYNANDNSVVEYSPIATYPYELNTVTTVTKQRYIGSVKQGAEEKVAELECGATSFTRVQAYDFEFTESEGNFLFYDENYAQNFTSTINTETLNCFGNDFERTFSRKFAEAKSTYSNKTITFTTEKLTEAQLDAGEKIVYTIRCVPKAEFAQGFIHKTIAYVKTYDTAQRRFVLASIDEQVVPRYYYVSADITCGNAYADADPLQYLKKGVQYNCYDMLRKALLTVDTYLVDTVDQNAYGLDSLWPEYPIIISDTDLIVRLKNVQMHETTFENKNLWEVLLQIGYYIHAIPYLEFAVDNTDRFELKFRQLGGTKMPDDDSVKITVFNSRNLSEYFTQYDSYVTNLYSPQNVVEEYIVPKTSSANYLVYDDTAELHTSKPLLEILEFKIFYNEAEASALSYIFEENVYQVLTSDNPKRIRPAKGNSLYFTMGDTKIKGLTYVPKQENGGDFPITIKEICRRLFKTENVHCNDLYFYVKYRSQDTARITQIRPDIQNFIRNSVYEKYPHHEQFYGQQDKIVDSERFSENLFGKLIRVGNGVYQRQEYVESGNGKESGDLVEIDGEPYYVTAVDNEGYADGIFQKVTYSKNFNQLSQICTIPSEPRFYEVSERSIIRREVRLHDFLELTTEYRENVGTPRFLNHDEWSTFVKNLLFFSDNSSLLPNYAYMRFMADHKRDHKKSSGITIPVNELFPSSETTPASGNTVTPKASSDHADCIVPVMRFPLHDSIVFEWDMDDNFKVGDYVKRIDSAYNTMQAVRYCDVLGRVDLFSFKLFNKAGLSKEQAQGLPTAVDEVVPDNAQCPILTPTGKAVALEKDCREALSFNYQIHLLHRPRPEDKEDFITFPNLFGRKASDLQLCFLRNPQNLFAENADFSLDNVLREGIEIAVVEAENGAIEIQIPQPENIELEDIKAIAMYEMGEDGRKHAVIVKNVAKLPNERKIDSWYMYPVYGL